MKCPWSVAKIVTMCIVLCSCNGFSDEADSGNNASTDSAIDADSAQDVSPDAPPDPCEGVTCEDGEVCQHGDCVSETADGDDDGHLALVDCNDSDPLVHPGAVETCNGIDDDCDPLTQDGVGECLGEELCCTLPPGCRSCCRDTDCDDGEVCSGGSCGSGLVDADSDGYSAVEDCDDSNGDVHPGAAEVCNSLDDDCDPSTADGADDCPGLCCGVPATCRECCSASDCDAGWECTDDNTCACPGQVCDGTCHVGGDCCSADDCAAGENCSAAHTCECTGLVCSGTCYPDGECCVNTDCGIRFTCNAQRCVCGGTGLVCSDVCYPEGECCLPTDCGFGGFSCDIHRQCDCTPGVVCGDYCHPFGECCSNADCGTGFSCGAHRCNCWGIDCGDICYPSGECCSNTDCGFGEICVNGTCY